MKVSYMWLQHHFHSHTEKDVGTSLPPPEKVAELLTFNAFQVEGIEKVGEDFVLTVDVLPNRAHDCLSHGGIARELGRVLNVPTYPEKLREYQIGSTKETFVEIQEPLLCPRYMAVVIENVTVTESPAWLKTRLAAVGQRSVNSIVDLTNFVMLETGQPLHAFDLEKLGNDDKGNPHIIVRKARAGESLTTLDGKELSLVEGTLVIADPAQAIALAGVKGGKHAEITSSTTSIVIESANFEPTQVRKASRAANLRTDSSARFEQGLAPELAEEGMRLMIEMVLTLCKGAKVGTISDAYPKKRQPYVVGVSTSEVNRLLGTSLTDDEVATILKQLHFTFEKVDPLKKILELTPKFEGIPYKYGASISYDAPLAFDCSSFTAYLYAQTGITIPRITVDQFIFGTPVEKKDLQPGDVVFAKNSGTGETQDFVRVADGETIKQHVRHVESREFLPGTKVADGVDHNGVYLGDGKVIHASGKWHKGSVVTENLDESPAFKDIVGYRRFVASDETRFVVTAPVERLDLRASRGFLVSGIKEDLIEEIGRTYGYRNIASIRPPKAELVPADDEKFSKAQAVRQALVTEGYSEVMTYAFRDKGDVELKNPLASDRKYLRKNLSDGLTEAYTMNKRNAPLLGLAEVKIFEIGTVFGKDKEEIRVAVAQEKGKIEEYSLHDAYEKFGKNVSGEPASIKDMRYTPISQYPFVLRDVAVFVPEGTDEKTVSSVIQLEARPLLVTMRLFDVFRKDGKVSYAFNLVFQSHEKTLSDAEVNGVMEKVTAALNSKWQVR